MGKKAEVGTPKYIANKMKSKGLQKLRWYCQMCQKQCRDENGFKCHTQSESHQRQLLLFADNSKRLLDDFSKEFASGMLEVLKRQFGTKRVAANRVYQEYITDRNHLHMNATRWVSLTGFVKYLGREGKCVVDETEKGWFITYIDRDPETIAMQEKLQRKVKMAKDDQERELAFLKKQIKRGKQFAKDTEPEPEVEEIDINAEDREKLKIDIAVVKPKVETKPIIFAETSKRKMDPDDSDGVKKEKKIRPSTSGKKNALDDIMATEEAAKERTNRKDYWLAEDIVVKIVTKSLGEDYFNKKGVVVQVLDKYSAVVRMLNTKHKLKLDQAHLETVIPAVGKLVKVVNGAYRGSIAVLVSVHPDQFAVTIEIHSGLLKGRRVNNVQYEDISKLNCE